MLAPDGTLKNHLCATDLQCLAPGSFHKLLLPVEAFLEQRPLLGGRTRGPEAAQVLVQLPKSSSLLCVQERVMQTFALDMEAYTSFQYCSVYSTSTAMRQTSVDRKEAAVGCHHL